MTVWAFIFDKTRVTTDGVTVYRVIVQTYVCRLSLTLKQRAFILRREITL